jgi:hypothetical protein
MEETAVMRALRSEQARMEVVNTLAKIRAAGDPAEKIMYAAMYSFARGLEVGRAAKAEDEEKPA